MKLAATGLGHMVPGTTAARRWLYRGLDLAPEPGTITAVVGPNGSGKTTLLRDLAGLLTPDAGEVALDGATLASLPGRDRARRISYLPQLTPMYHDLRVGELVMLGRAPHLGRFEAPTGRDHESVRAALDRVGLCELASRGVFSLSGGEYQRVMLARMLATDASILVLDEPTAALDIGHALDFLELCRRLAADGRTLAIAIHDLELARRYADAAVCLERNPEGRTTSGPAQTVLTPEVLGRVFGVDVRTEPSGLVFAPRG